jgi:glucose/arabinose dehydrogenase
MTYAKQVGLYGLLLWLTACGGSDNDSDESSSSSLPAQSSSLASTATSTNSSIISSSATSSSSSVLSGLSQRPSNITCLAPSPEATGTNTTISWQAAFPSLPNIALAVGLVQVPGDNGFWYVIRQPGVVLRFANIPGVNSYVEALNIEDRVELTGGETGLLGIAFHPQFTTNPYVYFYYIGREADGDLESRVARYTVAADGIINRGSEEILLRFTQPHDNHNGGQLAFGNDGYLYIASGDGGSGGDPDAYGQNRNTFLGKILRIDVDNTSAGRKYAIPSDNPYATSGGFPEIWAYGLRNPWRFSFDKDNNELWAGDVGQDDWEEINLITRGGNYGWGDMEGNSCYHGRPDCSTTNKILPIHVLDQEDGFCSVIGGFVYRGAQHPAAYGKYFFTDLCINTLSSITRESTGNYTVRNHGAIPTGSVSFA